MRVPSLGLMKPEESMLFNDYYNFTSSNVDLETMHSNTTVVHEYFFRKIPKHLGQYVLCVGLEQVIAYLNQLNRGLSNEDADWLMATCGGDLTDAFYSYLRNFHFDGDIYAVPEGTPMFPYEPCIVVKGKSIDVLLLETYLLNMVNFQSLIATKASRIVYAATRDGKGRSVVDFGARRAHGRDAAILGARAAYIGGATGTSLILAGKKFGIPYIGTMPHRFIQERTWNNEMVTVSFSEVEQLAYGDYSNVLPHNVILLVDTYDTIVGVKNAVLLGQDLRRRGYELKGIRLDSGDPLDLSIKSRKLLDDAGLFNTKIFVSDEMDEYRIAELLSKGAPIDGFGVGTRLITGANYNSSTNEGDVSALGGTYKLCSVGYRPSMKFTSDMSKATLPGVKQVWRLRDRDMFRGDTISQWDWRGSSKMYSLLAPIVRGGVSLYKFPDTEDIQAYAMEQLSLLPVAIRELDSTTPYPVTIQSDLEDLKMDIWFSYTSQYGDT